MYISGMLKAVPILAFLLLSATRLQAASAPEPEGPGMSRWVGRGALGLGYLLGAACASHYWWNSGVGRNPLANFERTSLTSRTICGTCGTART